MKSIFKLLPRLAYVFLLPFSFFLLLTACPDPPETVDCGTHQIEVNGACECEEGYHWNENQTKCLMDTTSHNFVWTIDTLGESGSYLNDIAIIDENNVWVVGYIKNGDSTYNAAHWDGSEWELILVSPMGLTNPISCIFACKENNIWFGKVGLPVHWDGQEYFKYTPTNSTHPGQPTINAIWGNSLDDIYFVGNNGSIVHYDGNTFTRMESGTEVNLLDVWGLNENHIWAVGEDRHPPRSVILFFYGNSWETEYYNDWSGEENCDSICGNFRTVWAWDDHVFLGGSAGIWDKSLDSNIWTLTRYTDINQMGFGEHRIRGNNKNDIIIVGLAQMRFHYNGVNWKDVGEDIYYS